MLGNTRRINNLKNKITLKVNNDIEINRRTLLRLIWLRLFPNISKCINRYLASRSMVSVFR